MPKIYPIVKFGDPVLEAPTPPLTKFDDDLKRLVDDMFASMYEAHGVGLAAPQIGISKRVAVIDVTFKEDPGAKLVLVNPEIIKTEGRQSGSEGGPGEETGDAPQHETGTDRGEQRRCSGG